MLSAQHIERMQARLLWHNFFRKKIKCLETGYVFDSIKDAAVWCNVKGSCISMFHKRKNNRAAGYTWEYADVLEKKV